MKQLKFITLIISLFILQSCKNLSSNKLIIATSANMQYAMQSLSEAYTKQSGIECELVISSSGKLTAQIKAGAPYDIFVSADMKYPNAIFNDGLAIAHPKVYAYGKLVLWTNIESITPSFDTLKSENIQHIALANPKTAPYGLAAIEALQSYKILDTLEPKLVYGESISQVNQFVTSQSSEIGFTSMSVVLSEQLKQTGQWIEVDKNRYTPISQGVVVIKNKSDVNIGAKGFYDFLFSIEAKEILKKFGYSVDE